MALRTFEPDQELAADAVDDAEFTMITIDDRTYTAASRTELVDALIPGYAALLAQVEAAEAAPADGSWVERPAVDPGAAEFARYKFAVEVAGVVNASALKESHLEPADLGEDDLNHLLRKDVAVEPFLGEWTHAVPLVLIRSDYHPYIAGWPKPTGDVYFIDPSNETRLLATLADLGVLELIPAGSAS